MGKITNFRTKLIINGRNNSYKIVHRWRHLISLMKRQHWFNLMSSITSWANNDLVLCHLMVSLEYNEVTMSDANALHCGPWARLNIKTVFPGMVISIIKIRSSWGSFIFIMTMPILFGLRLYTDMPPAHLCIKWTKYHAWQQQSWSELIW